jgi:hypothetical protein
VGCNTRWMRDIADKTSIVNLSIVNVIKSCHCKWFVLYILLEYCEVCINFRHWTYIIFKKIE